MRKKQKMHSLKNIFFGVFTLLFTVSFWGQELDLDAQYESRKHLREGNELLKSGKTEEAIIAYQKSTEANELDFKANNNLGTAYLENKKYEEAVKQFEIAASAAKEKKDKASVYHNMGVAQEKAKQLDKAIASYKKALTNNPKQEETRYNLANAIRKLKKQQQQQQQNKDGEGKDKNKDKNKDEKKGDKGDDKNSENKDKNDQNQDKEDKNKDNQKKDGDKKEDENKKDGDKNQQQGDKEQQKQENQKKKGQEPQKSKLSPAQIQQLLNAMNDKEKKTQDKVNAQKVKAKTKSNEKDW